jgi:hypothetical protein
MPRGRTEQRGQKTAAVKELLMGDPKMAVSEIQSTLAERGTPVHANLIYQIRRKMRTEQRRQKRLGAAPAGRNSGTANAATLVRSLKDLAAKAGGMEHLKELVEALAE